MKLNFKFFILQIIIFAFFVFGANSVISQDLTKECETIYESIPRKDKNITINDYKKYVVVAKKYLEKCSDSKGNEEVRDYLKKQISKIEKTIQDMEFFENFNGNVQAKNWDGIFVNSKEFVLRYPEFSLDVSLIFASIGYENAAAKLPNDKYNENAIFFANLALQKMESGVTSENYGAFAYTYKTKLCPNGKANSTGWMNYIIGYIMFYRQNQKAEAISYLEQSTQIGCETNNNPEIYYTIGGWYVDEFLRLEKSREEKLKANDGQETDETKSTLERQKKYFTKAKDAYSIAYKIVADNPKYPKSYKDMLYNKILKLSAIK